MSRVYALAAVEAGYDLVRALIGRGVPLAGIIALSANKKRAAVSGFAAPEQIAGLEDVPVIEVDDYTLRSETDRQRLAALEIDLLIVAGWQRLIPPWLIDHCGQGVIGLHGSATGISTGRGRSPQNWALLTGADHFEIAAFGIDAGVDSGPVLAERRFPYTPYDDIVSSYAKSMLLSAEMIAGIVSDWDDALRRARAQVDGSAEYLPQRRPEDGAIDWNQPSVHVRGQVAALTRPYPGAWTRIGDREMRIWSARPAGDFLLTRDAVPGEIVHLAGASAFLVRAADAFLMVDDFDVAGDRSPCVGDVLHSVPFSQTIEAIAKRHRENYPNQPLSRSFLALLRSRP